MIESVDNEKINEAGFKHSITLEKLVKDIDPSILETEEQKRQYKEIKDGIKLRRPDTATINTIQSVPGTPNITSPKKSTQKPALLEGGTDKEADSAELKIITNSDERLEEIADQLTKK